MTHSAWESFSMGTGRHTWFGLFVAFVVILVAVSNVLGAPPLDPTGPPLYSFDANSPKVLDGTVRADDLLRPGPEGQNPVVVLPGSNLGLGNMGDELGGLSSPNSGVGPTAEFAILFSISRTSLGGVAPDPVAVNSDIPYNAQDQAEKGQAAGDQFMSLTLFTGSGGPIPSGGGRAIDNNTLLRNNFDEGGVDFSADPPVSAEETAIARAPQDNVHSILGTAAGDGVVGPTFFTASAGCPTVGPRGVPTPCAADIFLNADPASGTAETVLFASAIDLGLDPLDVIGAMVVFDRDGDGSFGGPDDQVLFSLAPGSPSLPTIVAGRNSSPADVFSIYGTGGVTIFATATQLGLNAADSIDALDVLPCVANDTCDPVRRAIRTPPIPTVSTWGMITMVLLLATVGSVIFVRRRVQLG